MGDAKIIIRIVSTAKIKSPIEIMVDESCQAFSSLSRDKYWENIGMKASAIVPKIKTSKIASGKIEAAIKLSRSLMSPPKYEARSR